MRLPEAIRILKANTMACWWPDGPYPGKRGTDMDGIIGEVRTLLDGIKARQCIPSDAMFYVLDESDPETRLYSDLISAVQTVRRCQQSTS